MFVGLMLDWIEADMKENPEHLVERLAKLIKGNIAVGLQRFKI